MISINEVIKAIEERGYNPTSQLIGYLLSGDPLLHDLPLPADHRVRSRDQRRLGLGRAGRRRQRGRVVQPDAALRRHAPRRD